MTDPDRSARVTHPRIRPRRGAARSGTWWGKAWVRAVEESAYGEAELKAARSLARAGSVGAITLTTGRFLAAVEDGEELWSTGTSLAPLDDADRAAFVEAVAAEAGRLPALLAGELPHALVEHAEEAGVELLPFGGELQATCTCSAWVDPCAHALAAAYQVAWLADADPFVLLRSAGCRARRCSRGCTTGRAAGRAAAPTTCPTTWRWPSTPPPGRCGSSSCSTRVRRTWGICCETASGGRERPSRRRQSTLSPGLETRHSSLAGSGRVDAPRPGAIAVLAGSDRAALRSRS